jgi:hypothetical protein
MAVMKIRKDFNTAIYKVGGLGISNTANTAI